MCVCVCVCVCVSKATVLATLTSLILLISVISVAMGSTIIFDVRYVLFVWFVSMIIHISMIVQYPKTPERFFLFQTIWRVEELISCLLIVVLAGIATTVLHNTPHTHAHTHTHTHT